MWLWLQLRQCMPSASRNASAALPGSVLHDTIANRCMLLQVRLEHMLQRLRTLQDAAATGRPVAVLPNLFVSGAVEANSLHLLRHMGITHILNATEDLLQPDEGEGFQ